MNPYLQVSIIGLATLALFFWPPTVRLFKYVTTLFHEVGHAIIALILGGRISHIKLNFDGSGVTGTAHAITFRYIFVRILELLAGYSFPVNVGLLLLGLGLMGVDPMYLLIAAGVVAVFTILFVRNLFGFLVVIVYAGLLVVSYLLKDVISINYIVSFLAFILLFGGLRDIKGITQFNFSKQRKLAGDAGENDFTLLASATHISPLFWNGFFLLLQAGYIVGMVLLFIYR